MTSTDESALRQPLPDTSTFRLRVEVFAHPQREIWREVEVRSDTALDELHGILQVVMGWTDSHLHKFTLGPDWYSHAAPRLLTPFDVEEGEEGIPEGNVRLDQIVQNTDDVLLYVYDFGDDWHHKVSVRDVLPLDSAHELPRCMAGQYACPPENCGGAPGYTALMEIVEAALSGESLKRWAHERLGWLLRGVALPELPAAMDAFDVFAVNADLRRFTRDG